MNFPGIRAINSVNSSRGNFIPIVRILFAFREKVENFLGSFLVVSRVYIEPIYPILNNFQRAAKLRPESRNAGNHCFENCQAKSFKQGWLNKYTLTVGDYPVDFAGEAFGQSHSQPANFTVQVVLLDNCVELFNFFGFFVVFGFFDSQFTSY